MRVLSWAVGNVDSFLGAVLDIDGVIASASSDNHLKFRVGINVLCCYLSRSNN